jgi:hypothetical protein
VRDGNEEDGNENLGVEHGGVGGVSVVWQGNPASILYPRYWNRSGTRDPASDTWAGGSRRAPGDRGELSGN